MASIASDTNNIILDEENIITEQELENYIELADDSWLWDEEAKPIQIAAEPEEKECKKRDYETLDSLFVEDLNLNGHIIWWKPIAHV